MRSSSFPSSRSTSFPLDADVIYMIVLLLPEFHSLRSASHSCKFIHNVIETQWKAISRAVASNEAGLALPHCLRSVEYTVTGEHDHVAAEFRYPYERSNLTLDWHDALQLSKKGSVARALEDIYSWRYKDRSSRVSKLSRSIYRISLLSSAYGVRFAGSRGGYRQPRDDSTFLRQLPTSQLEELWENIIFLGNLLIWISRFEAWPPGTHITGQWKRPDEDAWRALAAYIGPEMVLDGFKRSSITDIFVREYETYSDSYGEFLIRPLHRLLLARWRSPRAAGDLRKSPFLIFDTIEGQGDRCGRCNVVSHNELWNQSNWTLLQGHLEKLIFHYLPGDLPKNSFERDCMQKFLVVMQFSAFMDRVLRFNHPKHGNGDPQQWICLKCAESTLQDRLLNPVWYYCEAQRDATHALLFNHLCEPAATRTPPRPSIHLSP